jgi:hypothetical protein
MKNDFITMQEYIERHTWPPAGGLRHLIRNKNNNGLAEANVIHRVGRRILIDEKGFLAWIGKT